MKKKKIEYGRKPVRVKKETTSLTNKDNTTEYYAKAMRLVEKYGR